MLCDDTVVVMVGSGRSFVRNLRALIDLSVLDVRAAATAALRTA